MPKVDSGDTTFVLLSAALVLLMTPGLAFFYGGLIRRRSVVNTMMMSFVAMGAIGVAWALAGYSLAFAPGHGVLAPLLGGLSRAGLAGVGAEPDARLAATVPQTAFVLFQAAFAVITPALVSGAVAERMKFGTFVVFSVLWSLLVYAPVAHWVWAPDGWLRHLGALDFAGGTVVHVNAGTAALVAAMMLGPRRGFPKAAALPHNVPFVLLGTGLLWFGWLGFNGGSALGANGVASGAFLTTFLAASAAGLAWVLMEQALHGRMSATGFATGAVAGLVGITPASGYVGPMAALLVGAGSAAVSWLGVRLKPKTGLDDALDVFGVHGLAGLFGSLATGVLASIAVNPYGADGSTRLLGLQAMASLAAMAWSAVATFGILAALRATMGLRVDAEVESEGIDPTAHGEQGYAELETSPSPVVREETAPEPRPQPAGENV